MLQTTISCSRCGKRKLIRYNNIVTTAYQWGSCGSALYCPDCTATWKRRNGDRPMNDRTGTIETIIERMSEEHRSDWEELKAARKQLVKDNPDYQYSPKEV